MQSSVLEWVQAQTCSKQKLEGDVLKKSDICMLRGRNRVKASIVFAFSPLVQFFGQCSQVFVFLLACSLGLSYKINYKNGKKRTLSPYLQSVCPQHQWVNDTDGTPLLRREKLHKIIYPYDHCTFLCVFSFLPAKAPRTRPWSWTPAQGL